MNMDITNRWIAEEALRGSEEQLRRGIPPSIPAEVALCLCRVSEECLHDVAKHPGATKVRESIAGAW